MASFEKIKRMNVAVTLEKRRLPTKKIIKDEIDDLKDGFNPITNKSTHGSN